MLGQERPEPLGIPGRVGTAEVAAGRVGDHVGAPGRIGGEAHGVRTLLGRRKAPSLEVRLGVLGRRTVGMEQQRRVEAGGRQFFERLRNPLGQLRVEDEAVLRQHHVRLRSPRVVEHDLCAGLGDALAQHGLRRRHELDSLFDQAAVAQQQLLLDCMFRVVPRIHLVCGQVDQVVPRRGDVHVQHHAAAEIAEVVVERPPRLVLHRLERQLLPGGQLEQLRGPPAENRQQLLQHGHRDRAVDEVLVAPRLTALVQRAVAREKLVELGVRRFVDARRRQLGPNAVAALDLVDIGDLGAREHVRVGRAPLHLVAQPAVFELGHQRVAVGGELRGVDGLLGVDLLLELGRAVVRVDQTVDMLAEPQSELEVALGVGHSRSRRRPSRRLRSLLSSVEPTLMPARRALPGPGRRRRTWWRDRTDPGAAAARAAA